MFKREVMLTIVTVVFFVCFQAQGMAQQYTLPVHKEHVSFRLESAVIDESFHDNSQRLSNTIAQLKKIYADSTLKITSVEFSAMASPEGGSALNHKLPLQRMEALESYIRSRINISDSIVSHSKKVVSWNSLDSLVVNSDMANRNQVSHIICNTPLFIVSQGKIVGGRRKQLMDHNAGSTWHEMNRRFLLNACVVVVTYEKVTPKQKQIQEERVETELPPVVKEQPPVVTEQPPVIKETVAHEPTVVNKTIVETTTKPFYMAIKTNALYDLLAIPNIGMEFNLGKKWSVATNWHYAWWKADPSSWYWRTYGGDITLRKWFGRKASQKPLTGHHIGIYGQILTYDFETGGRGYLGDRWSYAAGLEYGYSVPVGKRFNLDFTIGGGYLTGEYKEYLPMDECYVWQATKNRHWFGPTKAEISLVWLIGNGNINKGKGGK